MKRCNKLIDVGRRKFLTGGATAAAAVVAGGMAVMLPPTQPHRSRASTIRQAGSAT